MTTFRQRGAWSRITNLSDRGIVVTLLRTAGHANVVDRNIDLILSSKVKVDADGNVVELMLGKKDQSGTRYQQQQRQRQLGGNQDAEDNNDAAFYWDLSPSVKKLRKLDKLVLCHCRSLPSSLSELAELKCLELHSCHGDAMFHNVSGNKYFRLPCLKMLEICDGIWSDRSIIWVKNFTSTFVCDKSNNETNANHLTNLEVVRFSFLQPQLRNAILDFLFPFATGEGEYSTLSVNESYDEGERSARIYTLLSTSKLKRLTWAHSGMTEKCLEVLLKEVVLPHHPNLISIDVSGNQIRSLQFLLKLGYNDVYPSILMSSVKRDDEQIQRHARYCDTLYHPLRTLNLQHNPVLRHRYSDYREQESFESLLQHWFPLLGSLTPSWENWDARIEYLLRINRGGRVLVERNGVPLLVSKESRLNDTASAKGGRTISTDGKTKTSGNESTRSLKYFKMGIDLSVWPLVLHRAYKTSSRGFLPPIEDATAVYYLIRNGPAISEIFAADRI